MAALARYPFARMDRLVVLEAGRIVEQGTHAELLRLGAHYDKLWRHQSGGFLANELTPEPEETVEAAEEVRAAIASRER